MPSRLKHSTGTPPGGRAGVRGTRCGGEPLAPDGRERSKTSSKKADAERFLAEIEVSKGRGSWVDPRMGRVTFGDFPALWLDQHHGTESRTTQNIEGRLRNHYGHIDGMRLSEIRPSDVVAWRKGLTARLSNDTINSSHGTLRQILEAAVRDGILPRNVASDVKPLNKNKRKDIHPLTMEQVIALADEIDGRYRALILFAALGSGMRAGELWALQTSMISFLKPREVQVRQSVSELSDARLVTGKSSAEPRVIPHVDGEKQGTDR